MLAECPTDVWVEVKKEEQDQSSNAACRSGEHVNCLLSIGQDGSPHRLIQKHLDPQKVRDNRTRSLQRLTIAMIHDP